MEKRCSLTVCIGCWRKLHTIHALAGLFRDTNHTICFDNNNSNSKKTTTIDYQSLIHPTHRLASINFTRAGLILQLQEIVFLEE